MEKQIAVFSDIHYSKNWDTIDNCIKGTANNSESYLNPNKELRKFVDLINASSNVEAVINNGDSIDYNFCDYSSFKDFMKNRTDLQRMSNWDLFNKVINDLGKLYFAIPGNHDYRKEAYNYSIWGTGHVNLSARIRKKYKNQIGHNYFRGPFELFSIMVNEKKFNPLTKGLCLKKREDKDIADFHCIFMDNGSDAFVRPYNFIKYIKKIMQTRMISYDSDGLNKKDIQYLSRVLSRGIKKSILFFQHAPLINSKNSNPGKEYQLSIGNFEKISQKQKIAYSTIFNGGSELLKLLSDTDKNIVLVASHTHNAKYFLIDKKSLKAREVSNYLFNKEKDNARYIKQLTTLPLGGIDPKAGGYKTGFLKISPSGFEEIIFHDYT